MNQLVKTWLFIPILVCGISFSGDAIGESGKKEVLVYCNKVLEKSFPNYKNLSFESSEYFYKLGRFNCISVFMIPFSVSNLEMYKKLAAQILNKPMNELIRDIVDESSAIRHNLVNAIFISYLVLGQNKKAISFASKIIEMAERDEKYSLSSQVMSVPIFGILNDMQLTSRAINSRLKYEKVSSGKLSLFQMPNNLVNRAFGDIFRAGDAAQNRNFSEMLRIKREWETFSRSKSVSIAEILSQISGIMNFDLAILNCIASFGAGMINDYDSFDYYIRKCKNTVNSVRDENINYVMKYSINSIIENIAQGLENPSTLDSIKELLPLKSFNVTVGENPNFYYILLISDALNVDTATKAKERTADVDGCTYALNLALSNIGPLTPKDFVVSTVFNITNCFEKINSKGIGDNQIQKVKKLLSYIKDTQHSFDWRTIYASNVFSNMSAKETINKNAKVLTYSVKESETTGISLLNAVNASESFSNILNNFTNRYLKIFGCSKLDSLDKIIRSYKKYIYGSKNVDEGEIEDGLLFVNLYYTDRYFVSIISNQSKVVSSICHKHNNRREIVDMIDGLNKNIISYSKGFDDLFLSKYIGLDRVSNIDNIHEIRISPHANMFNIPWLLLKSKPGRYLVEDIDIVVSATGNVSKNNIFGGMTSPTEIEKNIYTYGSEVISITAHGVENKNIYKFKIELTNKDQIGVGSILDITKGFRGIVFSGCGFGKTHNIYNDVGVTGNSNLGIYQELFRNGAEKIVLTIDPGLAPYLQRKFSKIFDKFILSGKSFKQSFFDTLRKIVSEQGSYDPPTWWPYVYVE